jgi:indole-3-acetate monooxygenase
MDIQTSPDPVARAHELGTEIAAAADEIERARRIPEALLGRLHDSRLFRMLLPRSAGGDQTEPAVYVAAIEVLAQHDASVAWNVFVANSSALIAAYLDPAVNHAVFADPRSIVAWGPPNASRASAVDEGYRLTGKWDFASGCRQARWMGAHCHVREADGALRLNRFGRPTVRTLLFPASEATLSTPGGRSGCAARGRTPMASTNCSCPRRSALHARTRRRAAITDAMCHNLTSPRSDLWLC